MGIILFLVIIIISGIILITSHILEVRELKREIRGLKREIRFNDEVIENHRRDIDEIEELLGDPDKFMEQVKLLTIMQRDISFITSKQLLHRDRIKELEDRIKEQTLRQDIDPDTLEVIDNFVREYDYSRLGSKHLMTFEVKQHLYNLLSKYNKLIDK